MLFACGAESVPQLTDLAAILSAMSISKEHGMRYFFNLAGAVHDPDNLGYEFASLSDARIEAAKFAGEYLRDRPQVAWLGDEFRIEVTNKAGTLLFTFIAIGVDAPAAIGKK